MSKLKYFAPAIGWGIFVIVLSVMPGKDFPQIPELMGLLSVDKVVHMIFYALLTYLILRGVQRGGLQPTKVVFIVLTGFAAASFSMTLGWFLEWYQENYCEDRMFDILDGVANSIGAVAAWLVYSIRYYRKKKIKF